MQMVKKAVSADRRRYKNEDYDLDLTYITQHILAMGFPASGVEGVYRNHIDDVSRFLDEMHGDQYMIFNLSGRKYDNTKFHNNVLEFGWPDHHSPPLHMLYDISHSMDSWLKADEKNVAVVHCIAGKGRTGTVISGFLLWSKAVSDSSAALDYFARMRSERAIGVQYPSQHRYVKYFEDSIALSRDRPPPAEEVVLSQIVMHGVPNFDKENGGCHPILHVMKSPYVVDGIENAETIFRSSWDANPVSPDTGRVVFHVDRLCKGDILVRCYHCPLLTQTFGGSGPTSKMMFRFAFHTYFAQGTFQLQRQEIDLAHLDKKLRFPDNFSIEVILEKPQPGRDYSKDVVAERIKVKKEGWLWKQGKVNTAFKHRWFLLNDNYLSYYRSKKDSKPAGTIPLHSAQVQLLTMKEHPYAFGLETPERTFIIAADNNSELESWMVTIIRSKAVFEVAVSTHSLSMVMEEFGQECTSPAVSPSPSPSSHNNSHLLATGD